MSDTTPAAAPRLSSRGYVARSLDADERVTYTTRLTKAFYFLIWGFLILGVIYFFIARIIGILLILVALLMFLHVRSTEIAVTNKRFIYKRGWLRRKIDEYAIKQIEGVSVDQGPIARWLNYGTVSVRGTGVGDIKVKSVEDPLALRRAVTQIRLDLAPVVG